MTALHNSLLQAPTFWQLLLDREALSPEQLLLIEGDFRRQQATVRQVRVMAEVLAKALYERGIGPGTVVSWQMPTRLQTLVLALALARLGAIQNPILHLFRERELGDMLGQTQPQWLLVPPADEKVDYPARAQNVAADLKATQVLVLDGSVAAVEADTVLPAAPGDGNAVRWYYCTSGTTSGPKVVKHSDVSLMAGGHALAVSVDVKPTDINSIAYPVAHIGGAMVLAMLLKAGIPAVLIERFEPATTAAAFRRHGVTMTGGSTAHYQAWLALQQQAPETAIFTSVRMLTGGGASKPPQLYFRAQQELGIPIVHAYGMTESPLVASNTPACSDKALAYTDGKPVAGMQVRIQRGDGSEADIGEVGEVLVRGNCVCQGYLKPEQTREAFDASGYFHTGDLGSIDADGYISLSGRLKDIIIRKGENISAREIEELLIDCPGVDAVAVIGLPDEASGERVCAVIESSAVPALALADISRYLAQRGLMKQKWPEQLELIDKLPRSEALGKIAKKALQAQFAES